MPRMKRTRASPGALNCLPRALPPLSNARSRSCTIDSSSPIDWLDPRNSLHILRIVQEAFTNIIKYANATEVRVATAADAEGVTVTISDNGSGFDVESALKSGGKGLSNQMR